MVDEAARRAEMVIVCTGTVNEPHALRQLCSVFYSENPLPSLPYVQLLDTSPRRQRRGQVGPLRVHGRAESFYIEAESRWRHRIDCPSKKCPLSPVVRDEKLLAYVRDVRAAGRAQIELSELAATLDK
jgi:hypothetical protein